MMLLQLKLWGCPPITWPDQQTHQTFLVKLLQLIYNYSKSKCIILAKENCHGSNQK